MKFSDFDLAPDVLEALSRLGFHEPTPIQEQVIGPILARKDLIGRAETGTGKTIGYGAPIIGRMDPERLSVLALVLAPTRELARQVAEVLRELGAGRGVKVALLVGGMNASEQVMELRKGCQIAVGTPGRTLDFLGDGILSLGWSDVVVVDEADLMLEMGFIDDVGRILNRAPKERQTLLFSATFPRRLERLAARYMRDPQRYATREEDLATVEEIRQLYVDLRDRIDKLDFLAGFLRDRPEDFNLVFCNTRREVVELDRELWGRGFSVGSLHGDQEQAIRFRVLEGFRNREIHTLVATDVASRGLDIRGLTRVINYDIPDEPEIYVHRIGRTGRATELGEAVSLVGRRDRVGWRRIQKETRFSIEQIPWEGRPRAAREPRERRGGKGRGREGGRARRGRPGPPRTGGRRTARGGAGGRARAGRGGQRGGRGRMDGASGGRSGRGAGRDASAAAREERRPGFGEGRRPASGEERRPASGEERRPASGEGAGSAGSRKRKRRRRRRRKGPGGSPEGGRPRSP